MFFMKINMKIYSPHTKRHGKLYNPRHKKSDKV